MSMNKATGRVVLGFALLISPAAARAEVDVTTSMKLIQLQILAPAGYSLMIFPGVLATASATAQDSLGGNDGQSNTVPDGNTSASAMTTLASAGATASAPSLAATADSAVHIPQPVSASASSSANGDPFGSLNGSFEIVGAMGPVSVTLTAMLDYNQFLQTTGDGQSATSEVIFNLVLPDLDPNLNPILFFDNLFAIGPNDFKSQSGIPTLSNSVMLDANTPYSFIADVDAESSGLNVPEPSSWILSLTVFVLIALLFSRRERTRRAPTTAG
jgi:hypothetical protein